MTTRINYPQTSNTGKMIAQAVNDTLVARASMRRVSKLLDAATSGSDWTALANELGLVDVGTYTKAAQAQDLWTIMSTAKGVIDVGQVDELARLDQG